jgi:hypothetical protein
VRKQERIEKLENLQRAHLEELNVDGSIVYNTLKECGLKV